MSDLLVFVFGVIGFALLTQYVARTKTLEEQVRLLQQQVTIMQRTLGELVRRTASAPPHEARSPVVSSPEVEAVAPSVTKPGVSAWSRREMGAQAGTATVPARGANEIPASVRSRSRTQQELEALIGEKLLNRVGAVALILGVGFFMKYAFDRDWISPLVRVLLGVALGTGLVLLASVQRERLPIFAQGVLGAGLSILYLSAFSAFGFYHLVSRPVALLLLSGVTLLSLERGRRFGSIAVALIGWVGGFLTPFLIAGGTQTEPFGLFVYLVFLNVALLGLASSRREWWVLEPLSLIGTIINFVAWYSAARPASVVPTMAFLLAVWALYHGLDVIWEVKDPADNALGRGITATLNAAFFFTAVGVLLKDTDALQLKWVALALSVAYCLPGILLRRSIERHSLKSIVFLMTATGMHFDGFTRVEVWALEAVAFLAVGIASKTPHVHRYALGSFAFTVASLFLVPGAMNRSADHVAEPVFFNPRGFAFVAVALACGVGIFLYRWVKDGELVQELDHGRRALHYAWSFTLFVLITVEVLDFFDRRARLTTVSGDENSYATGLILASVWIGYGLVLSWAGSRGNRQSVGHVGIVTLLFGSVTTALFAVSYVPIADFRPVANLRFAVVMLTMAAIYAVTLFLRGEEWEGKVAIVLYVFIALLSFELLTTETRDYFQRQIARSGVSISAQERGVLEIGLQNKQQLAISAVWLLYATVAMAIGIARRIRGFRIAGISLLLLTILKVFLYDLSFLTELYRIFSFIGLGVILLTASFAYQRYKTLIFGEETPA